MRSSEAEESVETILADALDAVHRDAPSFGVALAESLARCPVDMVVDREAFTIDSAAGRARVSHGGGAPVGVRTSRRAVLALLNGELDLLMAVRSGELTVRGPRALVPRLLDSLALFLHGCARCSYAPAFIDRLDPSSRGATAETIHG